MKRIFKFVIRFFLLLIIAFVIFFFWASSSTLNENEYSKLVEVDQFESPKADSIYSIVTYNIGYLSGMTNNKAIDKSKKLFDDNLKKVQFETKKVNPDIIALQEIDFDASRSYNINQESEIANLGYNYRATSVNWDKKYLPFPYWPISLQFGKVVSGQSIISKYYLKEQERVVLQRVAETPYYRDAFYLDRLAQVVKVVLDKQEVIVINVHLEAFEKETRVRQFNRVLAIFNSYKKDYPTILLGDFNSRAKDSDAIIQKIIAMEDVGNAAFNLDLLENTFDTKAPFQRIDYIFYTKKSIKYVSGRVLNDFGQASDHFPVFMEFKLK